MTHCSSYAAAFGYQVYITPVSSCGVDLNSVTGGVKAGGFIDPTTLLGTSVAITSAGDGAEVQAAGSNIVYDNDVVTDETVLRLYGLTNAALETDTGSETVTTYDTESKGFDQNVAVSKSWSLSLEGVSQFTDSGYKVLRLLEQNAVAGGLKVKIGRIGPSGTAEAVYGYATLTGFSESIEAGSIVSWSVTAEGYGPYALDLDNSEVVIPTTGPIASLSIGTTGANLADGSFPALSLSGGTGSGATADVTISGGVVTGVTLQAAGTGYTAGDTLTAPAFSAAANPNAGEILTTTLTSGGSGYTGTTYTGVSLTGGSGSGATADITISAGVVTDVTITDGGTGYAASETLSANDADLGGGGGSGLVVTVDSVDENATLSATQPTFTVDSVS